MNDITVTTLIEINTNLYKQVTYYKSIVDSINEFCDEARPQLQEKLKIAMANNTQVSDVDLGKTMMLYEIVHRIVTASMAYEKGAAL